MSSAWPLRCLQAMFVDFGMAHAYGGHCYLRYDDTNPEAEKREYIEHIQEIVAWMGWKPWKVTYSSNYFQQLHELAVQLISSGHAFVCHQTKAEVEEYRCGVAGTKGRRHHGRPARVALFYLVYT